MKLFLLPHLICPHCLPREHGLILSATKEAHDEVLSGHLSCSKCKMRYAIRDGIAVLLADPDACFSRGHYRYEERDTVNRYLWSHYGDFCGTSANGDANAAWTDLLVPGDGPALDAGCSVGRMTLEWGNRCTWAVGCDISSSFIKTARTIARQREFRFSLPLEGKISEEFHFALPTDCRTDNVEFILADALRLPFRQGTFKGLSTINVVDRVSYPLGHLYDINRVAADHDASLLFASPFSWETGAAPEELWLGGKEHGEYRGRSIANVYRLLEGHGKILQPPWKVTRSGSVAWKMRTHCNHVEHFSSQYVTATR